MSHPREPARSTLGRWLALPVRGYRRWISPLKPPTCRFHPTCSAFAVEALELHGPIKGLRMAIWRVLRCQPLGKPGFDPVPGSALELRTRACASLVDVDTPRQDLGSLDASPEARTRQTR